MGIEITAVANNTIAAYVKNNDSGDNPINYYLAVKIAFQKNENRLLRQYLNLDNEEKIDKDLQVLWPFIYKIVNEERERIELVNVEPDNLLISCMPGKLTRCEELSKQISDNSPMT